LGAALDVAWPKKVLHHRPIAVKCFTFIFSQLCLELIEVIALCDVILAVDCHAFDTNRHILDRSFKLHPFQVNVLILLSFIRAQVVLNHFRLEVKVLRRFYFHKLHFFMLTLLFQSFEYLILVLLKVRVLTFVYVILY